MFWVKLYLQHLCQQKKKKKTFAPQIAKWPKIIYRFNALAMGVDRALKLEQTNLFCFKITKPYF